MVSTTSQNSSDSLRVCDGRAYPTSSYFGFIEAPRSGFTIIELVMIIALLSIVAVMGIEALGTTVDEERFDATISEMKLIRNSLLGNPESLNLGIRTNFGYLGDMGDLPTELQGLAAILTIPTGATSYSFNTTANYGMGWNGPYLNLSGPGQDITTDAFGTAYVYDNDGVNPASITSLGADTAAGGSGFDQDIVVLLPDQLRFSTVHGYILNNGSAFASTAVVELFTADGNGDLTTDTDSISALDAGHFEFTNVPYGYRSVKISIPNTTSPTLEIGPTLFTIDKPNITINTQSFDVGPAQASNSGVCTAGLLTPASALSVSGTGNVTVSFTADVAENVVVTRFYVATNVSGNALEEYDIQSNNYRCTGGQTFSACPLNEENTAELNNSMSLTAATGVSFSLDFDSDMSLVTGGTFILRLYYDDIGACDDIRI